MPHPFVGDLNGCEIHVDNELSIGEKFFAVAHLFGHTVQWNINPGKIDQWLPLKPPVRAWRLRTVMAYERQACAYSMTLLHDAGLDAYQTWFSDYAAADLAYLKHYYETGQRRALKSFWRPSQPVLGALDIPEFTVARRLWRSKRGVVI